MPGEDTHGLQIALATATALADEWRAKANQLLALCERLEGNLTEARAGRENWKEACRKAEQERDSRDWTGLKSERDALRAALQDIVTLCMDVPATEDWRAKVGDKARTALYGEAAWETK
jgi:hypothetical protein